MKNAMDIENLDTIALENRPEEKRVQIEPSSFILPTSSLYNATTFRRLLDSMARPGHVTQLDYPAFLGEPPVYFSEIYQTNLPVNFYALGAVLTLLDREVSVGLAANGRWLTPDAPALHWLTLRSGARLAEPSWADFVLFCDGLSGELMPQLNQGTLLEPENSATVFYCVEKLEGEPSLSEVAIRLELSGPGIPDTRTIGVSGLEYVELEMIKTTRRNYPLGLDIYLIDRTGQCVGLPRTTRISGE
jgi:alpha-D-ribose 1-methylphosphonate 5-triphosphate synthase subunit PhnH